MNAISMNNLWNYLQGLSLSASNRRWLAERLLNPTEKTEEGSEDSELLFPKIPKDYQVTDEVLSMACEPFPDDFDVEHKLEEMWEERTK